MVQRLRRWLHRRRLERLYKPIAAAYEDNPVAAFSWLPALQTALQRVSCDRAHYRARVRCTFEPQTPHFGSLIQLSERVLYAMNSKTMDLDRYRVSAKNPGHVNLDQYLIDGEGLPISEERARKVLSRHIQDHLDQLERWRNLDPTYTEYVQQELLYLYIDWMGLGLTLIEMELSLLQE